VCTGRNTIGIKNGTEGVAAAAAQNRRGRCTSVLCGGVSNGGQGHGAGGTQKRKVRRLQLCCSRKKKMLQAILFCFFLERGID
ncbi:hypothetical protein A2U01_0072929, partial [Trifolium medium]|nr:hypothetical protein [Trifolium medium]